MSRSKRSALTFLTSTFATLVSVGVGFVATPFLLLWLGTDRLGAFRVSVDWLSYLTLLELGTGAAVWALIVQARASGDPHREMTVLAAALRRYGRVAVLILIVGGGLVVVLPAITKTPDLYRRELWIGAGLYVAFVSLVFPLSLYRAFAEASQRGYVISSLLTVQGLVVTGMALVTAHSGWGLIGQFVSLAMGVVLFSIGLAIIERRTAPLPRLLRPTADLTEPTQRMRSLGRLMLLQNLLGRISLHTDNIIVSLFLGPAAVTAFYLTQRLTQSSLTVLVATGNATWAGLCELYQSGQHALFQQRLIETTKFTATLSGVLVFPLAVLTKPFVELWVGPDQYAGDWVAGLAVINTVLQASFSLWGWIFSGTGRMAAFLPFLIIQAILNLSVSLLATWQIGMVGPLIGTAVTNLAFNIWYFPRLLHRHFGVPSRQLLAAATVPLVPSLFAVALLVLTRTAWSEWFWWRLALEYGCAALITLLISWSVVLNTSEREMLRNLVRLFWLRVPRTSEVTSDGNSQRGESTAKQ